MASKADRAIEALRNCADALDALPDMFRRKNALFGNPTVASVPLRDEADWIENLVSSIRDMDLEVPDADG